MSRAKPIAGQPGCFLVICPACKCGHKFDTRWTFTGTLDKPTFRASMLTEATPAGTTPSGAKYDARPRCHSYVTDGRIEYLGDSTHELAGQTLDLPDFDELFKEPPAT